MQAPITEAPTNPYGSIISPTVGIPLSGISSASDENTELGNRKTRIGVLGLGSIGSRHLKNFRELGCEVAGYDPNQGQGPYSEREEVINWADAIVIATPTANHYQDLMTISMDKPVFVEKPIVDRYNLPSYIGNVLMVGYNLRFHSCVKKAREWLGAGVIGKPIWARFTCGQFNDRPDYRRDGVVLNWSHELDLAVHLLGTATVRGAATDQQEQESLADIILRHMNGCQTTVHLDYLTRYERRSFLIVGEEGSIQADLLARQAYHLNSAGLAVQRFGGRDTFSGNYLEEARCFLKRLEGEETLGCTAAEAMEVVKICFEVKVCAQ